MLKNRKKGEKGQAMVEFALILPLLILLLCGIIDFGWIFGNQLTLNNAVREAARTVSIHYDVDDDAANLELATEVIESRISGLMDIDNLETPELSISDEAITVLATYNLPILTPVLSTILGEDILIDAETSMRIE